MCRFMLSVGIALSVVGPLRAQETIPAARLSALKQATAFVRVENPLRPASGSAFLIHRKGDAGFFITNAHVVAPDDRTTLQVRLILGSGTPQEKDLIAEVVVSDQALDLALLKVETPELPAPIALKPAEEAQETLPLFILGFPFGRELARQESNPAVTVSRGSVSSIRHDPEGRVEVIQLDGELNPGNSGGPVVTAKGKLIGVAVAKIRGTNIGFAVPAYQAEAMLTGRVRNISFDEVKRAKDAVTMSVEIAIVDPLEEVTGVSVLIAPRDKEGAKPDALPQGGYKLLPRAKEHRLTLDGKKATGEFTVRLAEEPAGAFVFQPKTLRKSGAPTYSQAGDLKITFGEEQAAEAPAATGGTVSKPAVVEDFGKPDASLEKEVLTELPGEIQQVEVAGRGRYLVMKLRDVPGLAVYDLFKAELTKIIRLPSSDFLFAAGGGMAVVYFPENSVLQTWDLRSYEKLKTKPNPVSGVVKAIVMGHARSDRAVVRCATDRRAVNFILDTATLQAIRKDGADYTFTSTHHSSGDYVVQHRASADLGFIAEWATSVSPSGVGLFSWNGKEYVHKYEHDSMGNLVVGDDGYVYTTGGAVLSPQLAKSGRLDGQALYPAIGAGLVLALGVQDGKMMIYEAGKLTPVTPWSAFPEWPKEVNQYMWRHEGPAFDRRVIFMPTLGRVALLPFDDKHVLVRPFDLKAVLEASGVDYLLVTSTPASQVKPGEAWSYPVEVLSKAGEVNYKLELGPEGMTVSPEGLVKWDVPKEVNERGEKVVLLVSDKSGEQTYHNFTLAPAAK